MSIYDREYYRERVNPGRGGSFSQNVLRPQPGLPPVVKTLLIINVAVFIIQLLGRSAGIDLFISPHVGYAPNGAPVFGPSQFDKIFGLFNPYLIGRFMFWQFVTYQFLHGGLFHLFFNMFVLWMIGKLVERQIGSASFLRLYLLGGVFAGLINLLPHMFVDYPTVGASGAICAILAAFGLMNPNTRMVVFVLFFPLFVRARTLVIGYAIITVLFALGGGDDGIAHLAHLGGLIFGWMYVYNILYVRILIDGSRTPRAGQPSMNWSHLFRSLTSPFRSGPRVYRGEEYEDADYREVSPSSPGRSSHASPDSWDTRIDAVLDKMAKHGIHSLTKKEWEILDRYRKGK